MDRLFQNILQALRASLQQFYEDHLGWQNSENRLTYQLQAMLGRGEIDQDRYRQLRLRLQRGQLWQGDLDMIRQQAERRLEIQGKLHSCQGNKETKLALDRLYSDQVTAQEWLAELETYQKEVLEKARWAAEQAETARKEAQANLPDEVSSRASLEIWQDLLDLSMNLNMRTQSIEQSKRDLNASLVQLSAAITQLSFLETQEELAKFTFRLHQDLLTPGQRKA